MHWVGCRFPIPQPARGRFSRTSDGNSSTFIFSKPKRRKIRCSVLTRNFQSPDQTAWTVCVPRRTKCTSTTHSISTMCRRQRGTSSSVATNPHRSGSKIARAAHSPTPTPSTTSLSSPRSSKPHASCPT